MSDLEPCSAKLASSPAPVDPAERLASLLRADAAAEIAAALVEALRQDWACRDVQLLWSLGWPGERASWPKAPLSSARYELAERAFEAGSAAPPSVQGEDRALCLHRAGDGAGVVLLLRPEAGGTLPTGEPAFARLLDAARRRFAHWLEAARLRDSVLRLQQAEKVQRALFAIADMASSDLDMNDMLERLHQTVGGLMYAENFFIALYDAKRDAIRFIYYRDVADPEGVDTSHWVPLADFERVLTWYVIRDGRALMGPSHELRKQVSGPLRLVGEDSADWLGVPMLQGSEVRGVLVVQSYREGLCYSQADQALLSFVGSHILTALERKQGKAELERRVAERTQALADSNRVLAQEVEERQRGERLQQALFRIADLVGANDSIEALYRSIHEVVGSLITARNFYIALLADEGRELQFPYYVDEVETPPQSRPLGDGVTEYLLRFGKPLLASADELTALYRQGEFCRLGTPSVSWLGAPLVSSGKVLGALVVQSYAGGPTYTQRDLELLNFVSQQIAHTLERRQAADALRAAHAVLEQRVEERTRELREQIAVREKIELQLKHEVMHDGLTGLPNRGYLRDRLDRVLARQRRGRRQDFAVLYADVDRFKVINDSLGHLAGDEVLREVARRLQSCVREPDVVARLGGDEFAILLEEIPNAEVPVRVAQRIIAAMAEPLRVLDKEITTSTSVGVAMGDRRHRQADDVLRDADVAMYRAKRGGRHRFEIFDAELNQHALDVLQLESELRRGIAAHAFEPYFQPIVRLEDGHVVGHEALLRWNHPTRGVLAPGEFLAVAEESGSIEAIDWQMFAAACKRATTLPGGYITLNVAPRFLKQEDFSGRLLDVVRSSGLGPARVRIELTEGALLENPEHVIAVLDRLREAGVLTAVDDFGTGFSSLSYVHRFPLQTLKIDRSFVAELGTEREAGSRAVIRAILALAQSLGMDVVAEGIETEDQRRILLALGCGYGQGFLIGRPQPLQG